MFDDYDGWQTNSIIDEYESRQNFVDKMIEMKEKRDIRDRRFKEGREAYYDNEGKTFTKIFDGLEVSVTESYTSTSVKLGYNGIYCFGTTSLDRSSVYNRSQGICFNKEDFDEVSHKASLLRGEILDCAKRYNSMTPYESVTLADDLVFEKGRFDAKIDGYVKSSQKVNEEFLKECRSVFGDSVKWEDRFVYENLRVSEGFLKLCELEQRNNRYKKANVEIQKSGGNIKNAIRLGWNEKSGIAEMTVKGTDYGEPCLYTFFAKDGEYIMLKGDHFLNNNRDIRELNDISKVLGYEVLWSGGNKISVKDIGADSNQYRKKEFGKNDTVDFVVPINYPRDNISKLFFRVQELPYVRLLKKKDNQIEFSMMLEKYKANEYLSFNVSIKQKDDKFFGKVSDFCTLTKSNNETVDMKRDVSLEDSLSMIAKVVKELNSHKGFEFNVNNSEQKFTFPWLCSVTKFNEICKDVAYCINNKSMNLKK